jgi:DNA adenine methylase
MGSKEQLLGALWEQIGRYNPQSVLDLCSGSGVVSYMLKAQGCKVVSNDYMQMATTIANATVANSSTRLSVESVNSILTAPACPTGKIWKTYEDIYFCKSDMEFLDRATNTVQKMPSTEKSIAMAALIRACIKRRPRGIFTYTGNRYDDGRKDLRLSLAEHFVSAVNQLNAAIFDNGHVSEVCNIDLSHKFPDHHTDVVYLDPPYFSPLSDNEYVRRYHFTEAMAKNWMGVEIQQETKTKKIRNYPSPFRSEIGCIRAIGEILDFYKNSVVVISYSSNSLPTATSMLALMKRHGRRSSVTEIDHRYSFGNQAITKVPLRNKVKELIFVGE